MQSARFLLAAVLGFVTPALFAQTNLRVLGDSISKGIGASPESNRYSTLLANALGVNEINPSVSGGTLVDASYVHHMFDEWEGLFLNGDPDDYALIYLGTNDNDWIYKHPGDIAVFSQRLEIIVQGLLDYGYAPSRIILCAPYYFGGREPYRTQLWNAIHDTATAHLTVFADFYATGTSGWFYSHRADEIHPNNAGHQDLANWVLDALANYTGTPQVTITSPADGAYVLAGSSVGITVDAIDDGSVQEVRFYGDGSLLFTDLAAPYSFTWGGLSLGAHQIEVTAEDDLGLTETRSVTISAVLDFPPNVAFADASGNATISFGDTLDLDLLVDDPDGTITSVVLLADGVPVATLANAPYTYAFQGQVLGTTTMTAQATDDYGNTTLSDPFVVTVLPVNEAGIAAAINCGNGTTYTNGDGLYYEADVYYTGGGPLTKPDSQAVLDTDEPPLYRTVRLGGAFSYAIPLADGTYEVTVKTTEIYWTSPGLRVFDILFEGQLAFDDVDPFALTGGKFRALELVSEVTVSDGVLEIEFDASADNAVACALVVRELDAPVDQPPVVDAGPDLFLTLPQNAVTIQGSVTDDVGVGAVGWSLIGGPSAPSLSGTDTLSLSVSGLIEGAYEFQLNGTDSIGQVSLDRVFVVVSAATNEPPQVDAGPDQSIQLPVASVSLGGSASDDTGIAGVLWTQESGPAAASLTNASALNAQADNLIAGAYVFRLTATDLDGAQASDTVAVTVLPDGGGTGSLLYAINCGGPDYPSASEGITYEADAYYTGGGTSAKTGTVSNTADPELYLKYRYGSSAYDLPIGAATTVQVTLKMAEIFHSGSGQRRFDIFVEGVQVADELDLVATTGSSRVAYLLTTTATVTDGNLDLDFVTTLDNALIQAIVVETLGGPVDSPPGITLTSPAEGLTFRVGDDVLVSAQATDDSAVAAVEFRWDGQVVGTVTTPPYELVLGNATAGTHVLAAIATDDAGQSATTTRSVTLVANQPPTVDAGSDQALTSPEDTTLLTATTTDDDGIASLLWSQASGPATATFSDPAASATTVSGLSAVGTYVFRLTATDTGGASAEDTVSVTVAEASSATQIALNCNGPSHTDVEGVAYEAATPYVSGGSSSSKTYSYANADPDDYILYNTYCLGDFAIAVPVPDGNYTVTLRFAEVYWGDAGQRVFDVAAEGVTVLPAFDIVAAAGGNKRAYDVDLAVSVTDGELNLQFTSLVNLSLLNALIITPVP